MQELEPPWCNLLGHEGNASDVAARPGKAGDKTKLDRVLADGKDNWNGCGRVLCCQHRRWASDCKNHVYPTTNQFGRQRRKPVIVTFRRAIFDRHGAAIDVTGFFK